MLSGTKWAIIFGPTHPARRGRSGACVSAQSRTTGGSRNDPRGFFEVGGLCLGFCVGDQPGGFFGGADLEGVTMSEETMMVALVCFAVGFSLIGPVLGHLISSRILDREFANDLARPRIEHVPKLSKNTKPFLINFVSEFCVFTREFFSELCVFSCEVCLEVKLLVQQLFLKSSVEKGIQKAAQDCADNGSADAYKDGFESHSAEASRGESKAQAQEVRP